MWNTSLHNLHRLYDIDTYAISSYSIYFTELDHSPELGQKWRGMRFGSVGVGNFLGQNSKRKNTRLYKVRNL